MSWGAGGGSSSARKTAWRSPGPVAASTPHAALRLGSLARDQLKSRHVCADFMRSIVRDSANAVGPSGLISKKRRQVCLALGAAVELKPHAAAMDVAGALDNPAAKGVERVRSESGRHFYKVKGSREGDVYLTYNGYCSCMFFQKNAERDSFFKCKHMIATEMVSGGLSLKTCPERVVSNEEYAKEILDFMPGA